MILKKMFRNIQMDKAAQPLSRLAALKAFTLAEIFIAMVVLSVLVSVSIAFFRNQKDYEREYLYYTAYNNLVTVVDSALANDAYLTSRTELGTCNGNSRCRLFRSASGTLCNVFNDYFNTTAHNCSAVATTDTDGTHPAVTLTNGMQISFLTTQASANNALFTSEVIVTDKNGWIVIVDINGHGKGQDKAYYDKMPFFISRSGKVIPLFGQVNGIRGYETAAPTLDAGGNNSLLAFDVVYTASTTSNNLSILNGGHGVSFRQAACLSGYLNQADTYCTTPVAVTKSATCTTAADCKMRVVKKLKRAR